MPDIGKAYLQIVPSGQGIQGSISNLLNNEASGAGEIAGQKISGGIKKALLAAGIGKALKDVISGALSEGGQLEQSIGGVEAVFGDSADKVKEYAQNSWQTVGVSANEYMKGVTGFSAALIRSLGGDTDKAAEIANQAFVDMGDNANRFGTDIESIRYAYQGFAKQNYTMLDNLNLGFAGSKQGMQDLLQYASELSGQDYSIDNLSDVYEAIHVVQEEMKVTGTTANEAATTLQGSMGAMGAAWQDLLGNMALGENLQQPLMNVANAVSTFLTQNLFPMILNLLTALPGAIGGLVSTMVPQLMQTGTEFITSITQGLSSKIPELLGQALPMILEFSGTLRQNFGLLVDAGIEFIIELVQGLMDGLPQLIAYVPQIISNFVGIINDNMPKILKAGWEILKTIVQGLINAIPALIQNGRNIINMFLDIWEAINWLQLGKDVIGFIANGVVALASRIPQAIKNIGQTAVRWFKDIDWWGLGKNIITGIINGIRNAGHMIADTLLGFARNAWNAAKSFLGIGSPSKLFAKTVGAWIPPGIAVGIESTKQVALDAMDELNSELATGINPSMAIGATTGTLNGAVGNGLTAPNYLINVNANMDGTPLKTKIANYTINAISEIELNGMRAQGI